MTKRWPRRAAGSMPTPKIRPTCPPTFASPPSRWRRSAATATCTTRCGSSKRARRCTKRSCASSGRCPDSRIPELIQETLDRSLDDDHIRSQDTISVMVATASNPHGREPRLALPQGQLGRVRPPLRRGRIRHHAAGQHSRGVHHGGKARGGQGVLRGLIPFRPPSAPYARSWSECPTTSPGWTRTATT